MREKVSPPAPSGSLRFLYHTAIGGVFLRLLTRRWLSRLAGAFLDSRLSKCLIKGYIRRHNIHTADYEDVRYRSFNAFFTRKIKPGLRPFDRSPQALCAPCDGKLTVYPISSDDRFTVKGFSYTAEELLRDRELAARYRGGWCLIFRLTVSDYHRYCFFDGGSAERGGFIRGKLHTVQPTALEKRRVFTENCREWTLLRTDRFGDAVQVEVGALMVGRIVNEPKKTFARGEEKGRFEFGGSTVLLLLEPGRAVIDEELLLNTRAGYETVVRCGEKIGSATAPEGATPSSFGSDSQNKA